MHNACKIGIHRAINVKGQCEHAGDLDLIRVRAAVRCPDAMEEILRENSNILVKAAAMRLNAGKHLRIASRLKDFVGEGGAGGDNLI